MQFDTDGLTMVLAVDTPHGLGASGCSVRRPGLHRSTVARFSRWGRLGGSTV